MVVVKIDNKNVTTVRPMRPRMLAALAGGSALAGAALILLVAWAAGWLHGEAHRRRAGGNGARCGRDARARAPADRRSFDPAAIYAQRVARRRHDLLVFGRAGPTARPGLRLRRLARTASILTNSHVITNAGEATGCRVRPADQVYVEFADRDRVPARDRRLGRLRRRRRAPRRPAGARADAAAARRLEPRRRRRAGRGDRQPVRQRELARGRRRLRDVGRSIESLTSPATTSSTRSRSTRRSTTATRAARCFDARGRVIGINAQIRSDTGNAEGVGFAVPINAAGAR